MRSAVAAWWADPYRRRSAWLLLIRLSTIVDLAIIAGVTLLYARPILDFNEALGPAFGQDWESASAPIALARQSILHHAEVPLWNPYFGTGVPFLGEPKTFLFNPVASAPALIFGPVNGPKVSAALSMIVTGLGMYYLAAVAGVSRPMRIWAGLTLALSGVLTARIWAGHFNLVMAFPYVPLVFALTIQALRRPGVAYPMLAGLSGALVYVSGQVYYTVFAIPGLMVTAAFILAAEAWSSRPQFARLVPMALRGLAAAGWAAGFAAIHLVPQIEARSIIGAPLYGLGETHSFIDSAHLFFIGDIQEIQGNLPSVFEWWEYYSYLGWLPVAGVALALPALLLRGRRLMIALSATLCTMYIAWASATHTNFDELYETFTELQHLRIPGRTLAFAAPFLILLTALSIDRLLEMLRREERWAFVLDTGSGVSRVRLALGPLVALALLVVPFYMLDNVFDTNRQLVHSFERPKERAALASRLQQLDPSVYYVTEPRQGQSLSIDFYEAGIKRLDANWEYGFIREPPRDQGEASVRIEVQPKYFVAERNDPVPNDARLVRFSGRRAIYELPFSPPYASTFDEATSPGRTPALWPVLTRQSEARVLSANVIEVRAEPAANHNRLLLLETYATDWRLEIDGEGTAPPDNYGGFLSTEALPGLHTYTFVYDPDSFRYGAAVTIGTLLGAIVLLVSGPAARLYRRREGSQEDT